MRYLRLGGNVLDGVGFAATTYNAIAKYNNQNLHTSDLVDMGFSGLVLGAGMLMSAPVSIGVVAVVGISYGIYRLTPAADNADAWIDNKFGY